jgi:hypothetical protein
VTIADRGKPCTLRGRPSELIGVERSGRHRTLHPGRIDHDIARAALTGKAATLDRSHSADVLLVTGTACPAGQRRPRRSARFTSLILGIGDGWLRVHYLGGPEPVDLTLGIWLPCGLSMSRFDASYATH